MTKKTKKENRPRVGVGVMIFRDDKVLLGKRKGSHGAGQYSFPGGHLEYMEGCDECAIREVAEEAGIKIQKLRFQYVANVHTYKPRHYIHIGFTAQWRSGEPKVMEPKKNESWGWHEFDELPAPLFKMCELAFHSRKTGVKYYEV